MIVYLFLNRSQPFKADYSVAKPLFVYYVIVAIIGVCGDLFEGYGYTIVFARMVPAVIYFSFTLKFIDNKVTLNWVLLFLTGWVLLDGIATILQGINNPIGWAIAAFTQTAESLAQNREFIDKTDSSIGQSFAVGITGFVVANGYYLASYGLLFLVPLLKRHIYSVIYALILFFVTLAALYYNQQRTGFYMFIVCSIAIFIYYIRNAKSLKSALFIIILSAALVVPGLDIFSNLDLGRLSEVSTTVVKDRNKDTREYFTKYIWQGENALLGNQTKWEKCHGGFTPHNMFAETTLQGGLIGLFVFVLFLFKYAREFINSFRRKQILPMLLAAIGWTIILVSLSHSSGFHTGLTMATTSLALYLLSRDLKDEN